jgi:copper chaperone CopZ
MKATLLTAFILFVFGTSFGQKKATTTETIVIQTSAQCADCKERIENALNYTNGVKFAEMDLTTKKVTVKYATSKISAQAIKEVISKIGYDADELKAKKEAIEKLPKCCQPNGHH